MGEIDAEAKKYMSDNARFADAFNYLIYSGRPVIDPIKLMPLDTTEIVIPYGNEAREPVQKFRDLLKLWQAMTDGRAIYVVLGIELESEVNYAMPVKSGLYDFMHYAKQVEESKKSYRQQDGKDEKITLQGGEFLTGFRKEDRLMPVITLVFYLGSSEWDGPVALREMFSTQDDELLAFIPDYRINLIAPYRMESEDFQKFRTNIGQLLEYIKYSKDKKKLDEVVHDGDRFRSIEKETADLINAITGSKLKYEVKEGRVDVCQAIEEMRKESKNEGENRLAALMKRLFDLGRVDDAQKAASDQSYRKLLFKEFNIV